MDDRTTPQLTWALRSGELTFPIEVLCAVTEPVEVWSFEKKLYICAGFSPERKAMNR